MKVRRIRFLWNYDSNTKTAHQKNEPDIATTIPIQETPLYGGPLHGHRYQNIFRDILSTRIEKCHREFESPHLTETETETTAAAAAAAYLKEMVIRKTTECTFYSSIRN